MRIGFLGLGTMGAALANNLRKSGHAVTVWNRTPAKAEALVRKGARQALTPKICATGQDLVFLCVSDEKAVDAVLGGPEGILAGLKTGDVLVDASTDGIRCARSTGARLEAQGASLLCAPLFGSRAAAEKAQLTVVVGGPAAARGRARPAIHAISARIIELEDAVQASLMKLVVNAVGGAMMSAFGEALAFGMSGGLDPAKVIETIQASSYHSPLFLMKGELIMQKDWAPRFALALAEKDQRLAQEAAEELGAKLPVNTAVRKLLSDAIQTGRGDKDFCAVADLLFEWAGVKR
jgi:3-hydroxyisobutyrate dehydrogenase-like beta-hydroxyacid dehydrogenase